MPVDLSRIGLEGIETAQRTMNSIAARKSQEIEDFVKLGTYEREEQDRAIDEAALNNAMAIAEGRGVDISSAAATPEDFGEFFDTLGTQYLKAGAAKRGKEFIEAGIDYRKKSAEVDAADDEAAQTRLENMKFAADWVAQNIGENDSEYQLFLSNLQNPDNPVAEILGRDNIEVLNKSEWTPELSNYFRSKALSIKDQATLELTARSHNRMERSLDNTERYRSALLELSNARLEEQRRANELRNKESGPDVGKAATNAEIGTAKSAILNTVKGLEGVAPEKGTPEEAALGHMAEDVAARAKVIVAENKGLTYAEAVNQAVSEAETAGDFSIIETRTKRAFGILPDSVARKGAYQKRGRSPENPINLPTGDEKSVRKRLVKGRYYQTPMGVLKWNGSSFDQ